MISRKDSMPVEAREHMRGGEGTVHLIRVFPELPANARIFSVIELQPGESIGYHVHENETELFYFLQGTALVRDDEAEETLTAGDALSTPNGHGHGVKNIGKDPVRMVADIVKD